ncbi:MAG TPA: ABATE domain-containing protein [Dongiaceae bacterium]|nr:ABATE domain-containing protein [Dongiaceae bacterium]
MSRQQALQALKSLSPGRAGRLPIVGGRACLDFINTSSGRGSDHHKENLKSYFDLLAWAHHAGILTAGDTLELVARARARPAAAHRAFSRALALREALHAIFAATIQRAPVPAPAVAAFNGFMAKTARAERFEPASGGFGWGWSAAQPTGLDRTLWPIVRTAVELLADGPLDRLKACGGGSACGWIFLDQTRNGRRRWCEMEVCGSRAKMRRYRGRLAKSRAGSRSSLVMLRKNKI